MSKSSAEKDAHWMRRCLTLARRGAGRTSPNPMVGAVLVGDYSDVEGVRDREALRDAFLLGEGWHQRYGGPHAEVNALEDAGTVIGLNEATLYVNLEPCAHHGQTPPCTDLILEKGIGRVVVGMADPHAEAGGGIQRLREAGVEVHVGVLGEACRRLNEAFVHHVRTGRPLVILKQAQTLTGQVATASGDSRWISAEASRRRVHRWRRETDAVLVGSGTARADDPRLTVRLDSPSSTETPQPRRFVLDRTGQLSPDLNLFSDDHAARTTAVVSNEHAQEQPPAYAEALRAAGGRLLQIPQQDDHLNLEALLDRLGAPPDGEAPVQSLFVEAGPGLATALFRQDLVDRYYLFVAPRLLGAGTPAVGALGAEAMSDARSFAEHAWETVGPDVLFKGFLRSV